MSNNNNNNSNHLTLTNILYTLLVSTLLLIAVLFSFWRNSNTSNNMSRPLTKSSEKALINEFREITGASTTDATKWLKKYKYNLSTAVNAFFNDGGDVAVKSNKNESQKKIGDVWERFKDASQPKLITIEGTLELCGELGIDPSSDSVLFCLAADLGSKATGEWEKEPFVQGWLAIDSNIDSVAKMKAALPGLREKLVSDPVYFKKVYMHTFDLCKAPGARVLALDTAIDMWNLFVPPALKSSPSALSRVAAGESPTGPATATPAAFQAPELELWLDFQRSKGKAVSKDTWSLFIDFIRTIDNKFADYDEEAAWPSTIDDFVEYARAKRA